MLLVFSAPSCYLIDDAPQQYKDVITSYKKFLDNILNGKQRSIILPSDTDENGNKLFDLQVYETEENRVIIKENV